jgi:hypothetical protein
MLCCAALCSCPSNITTCYLHKHDCYPGCYLVFADVPDLVENFEEAAK